ncbi:MAG: DUF4230 domain-containing protein [Anaerolineae bacterium]|nr:DUF4230 domain-containing protein [Anaerolineae bacterium]
MRKTLGRVVSFILILLIFGLGLFGGFVIADRGLLGLLGVGERSITATVILERIQALAELTTTRYNFSGIVTTEREMPPLLQVIYGDRQVLVAVGTIEAGVDLRQLTGESIQIAGDTLSVTLPAARLQSCAIDESKTYVVERDTGIFAPETLNLDSEARRFAIVQFRDQALESGVLEQAQDEARTVITQIILAINAAIERVEITFEAPGDNVVLPDSCL